MTISEIRPQDSSRYPMSDALKQCIAALVDGGAVLLLDDNQRENEADLVIAAEKVTPTSINFLIKKGSGVVCLALPQKRLQQLSLPLMVSHNSNTFETAFTVSIEASQGVTTGVSAKDRAHTIAVAMKDEAKASDLARPGHVFPLAAQELGVFKRMGHTEGSVDLMRIAGLKPGAVLCELMNEDGSMVVGHDRILFAQQFNLPVISVEEILCFRFMSEPIFTGENKAVASKFGQLLWHRFDFLDSIRLDIFQKENSSRGNISDGSRINVIKAGDLHRRLLAQILASTDDDPLVHGLKSLSADDSDFVIMCHHKEELHKRNARERNLYLNAAIGRSLLELSIDKVCSSTIDDDLGRVLENFFFIQMR